MAKSKSKTVAVILAAGPSSRMGQPKQLLKVSNDSLIRKTIREAIAAEVDRVIVVLGSNYQIIKKEIDNLPVEIIFNNEWEKGMGNSIKYGLKHALKIMEMDAIIFIVCDQPLLSSAHLKKLMNEHQESQLPIIASKYSGSNGVPAFFHQSMFEEIFLIEDHAGAKKIIDQNSALVKTVDFPEGAIDLDTPEDYQRFNF